MRSRTSLPLALVAATALLAGACATAPRDRPPSARPERAGPPARVAGPSRAAAPADRGGGALPDPGVTFASYRELCDGGDGPACVRAGAELANGKNGPPDAPGAARLYAQACQLGQGAGCRLLGWMLQRGSGIPADRRAAAGWLVRGCEHGDLEGCRSGGFALAYGDGVPADPRRALPMLERACAGDGFPRACAALGDLREKASPPDLARALDAYRRGCSQRDEDCCGRAARLERR
jgi:TPR repeat protein